MSQKTILNNNIHLVFKHSEHKSTTTQNNGTKKTCLNTKPLLSIWGEKVSNMTRNFLSFTHKLLGGWKAASFQLLHLLPQTQT